MPGKGCVFQERQRILTEMFWKYPPPLLTLSLSVLGPQILLVSGNIKTKQDIAGADPYRFPPFYGNRSDIFRITQKLQKGDLRNKKIHNIC